MYATFQARAQAVSAEVHRFPGRGPALQFLADLLEREGVGDEEVGAVWADAGFLQEADRAQLSARLPGLRFDVTREAAAASRVGVSEFDYAVANTGTLAQSAEAVEQRLASTLPEIHVALVDPGRLLPDLPALFARLGPAQTRYLALVTGPSRTADIERVLTIGVHGPRRLVIAFVDGLKGRS